MKSKMFVKADEIAKDLGMSKQFAYKLIRDMNYELKAKGFIAIHGRVSRQFYEENFYGFINIMDAQGYYTDWRDTRKYIVFTHPNGKKVRDATLSKTFKVNISKENINNEYGRHTQHNEQRQYG